MLLCRLLGHRPRFRADGEVVRWECERGCGCTGAKVYAAPTMARRHPLIFDPHGHHDGRRAPGVGTLLPRS